MRYITNNHVREFISGCDVPESVKADYDFLDKDSFSDSYWIKYRGTYYRISDFSLYELDGWAGSHFVGWGLSIVIKFRDEGYIIGTAKG